jgi:hypothetical protein
MPALPKVTVNALSGLEGKGGLTPFVFQVRLPGGGSATGPVTYDVYTTDGSAKAGVNYVGITAGDAGHGGTVTFARGATTATVTVYVIAGSIPATPATARETFTVNISDPQDPSVPLASAIGTIIAQTASTAHASLSLSAPAARASAQEQGWPLIMNQGKNPEFRRSIPGTHVYTAFGTDVLDHVFSRTGNRINLTPAPSPAKLYASCYSPYTETN